MRRLTEFERKIVTEISQAKTAGIRFYELILRFHNKDVIYIFEKTEDAKEPSYHVTFYMKVKSSLSQVEKFKYLDEVGLSVKKYFDCLYLINLLDLNGLIHIKTGYTPNGITSFPVHPPDTIDDSELFKLFINEDSDNFTEYEFLGHEVLNEKTFNIFTNAYINPSSALEIYYENGFRTEEQKLNDESIQHNIVTQHQSEEALKVAGKSASQAKNAVYATVLLGLLTLMYSCYRDFKNDQKEEKRPTYQLRLVK